MLQLCAGNTIFNLLRFSNVECDDHDRPLDDVTLKSVEVLWNPFDDLSPRLFSYQPSVFLRIEN